MEKCESIKPVLTEKPDNLIQNDDCFINVSAPGKVILHGEHSVVYGRLAIAASLGLRTHLTLTELSSGDELCIDFLDLKHSSTFSIKEIMSNISEQLRNMANVATFASPESSDHFSLLQKINLLLEGKEDQINNAYKIFIYLLSTMILPFYKPAKSIKVEVRTDLQISSGMGSSASFAVSIAAGLYEYLRIHCNSINADMKTLIHSLNPNRTNDLSNRELQLISAWAFQGEKITHGNPSGVDNTICTFGSIVKFIKGEEPKLLRMKTNLKVLLVDTGVPKNTKALVAKVASFKSEFPELVEEVLTNLQEIASKAYQSFVDLNDEQLSSDELYRTLGYLADENQELLKTLGVSHPTIDEICSILKSCGFHPKLTGAGGGGFVIALVPPSKSRDEIYISIDKLQTANYKAVLLALGGEGVTIH